MESQPHRMFYFLGCIYWGIVTWNDQWCIDRNYLIFCRNGDTIIKPASCFLGIQPGHKHFRDLAESRQIHEIEGVLIYRFSSNLFFANAGVLQQDIEQELERRGNIKAVILDASGIGSMDITAADRIEILL